jgi:hypothetical protein
VGEKLKLIESLEAARNEVKGTIETIVDDLFSKS